jgi:hypothetical protein
MQTTGIRPLDTFLQLFVGADQEANDSFLRLRTLDQGATYIEGGDEVFALDLE